MTRLLPAIMAMIIGSVPTALVSAQSDSGGRAQIEARLEQRYPKLRAAVTEGQIGETWQGFVEIVPDSGEADAGLKSLIEQENADRRALYAIIAADTSTEKVKVSPAMVGEQSGQRSYRRGKPADYFMARNGAWIQRDDVDELKAAGKIGETWQGRVQAVISDFTSDKKIAAVVSTENERRSEQYTRQAHEQKSTAEKIGEQRGERAWSELPSGFWFLKRDGAWVQK